MEERPKARGHRGWSGDGFEDEETLSFGGVPKKWGVKGGSAENLGRSLLRLRGELYAGSRTRPVGNMLKGKDP